MPLAPSDPDDLDVRRRRAAYRAAHRGTKEMDILMSRFAEASLPAMGEAELARFEQFLALPDPDLQRWILEPGPGPDTDMATATAAAGHEMGDLVLALRRFHGLAAKP